MKPFEYTVGGNIRKYGTFSVHEVTPSKTESDQKPEQSKQNSKSRYVALDKVGALETLQKLGEHGPAGLGDIDCRKQRDEMMSELENIVSKDSHLRGKLKVVKYDPIEDEHVGDAILAAIETN